MPDRRTEFEALEGDTGNIGAPTVEDQINAIGIGRVSDRKSYRRLSRGCMGQEEHAAAVRDRLLDLSNALCLLSRSDYSVHHADDRWLCGRMQTAGFHDHLGGADAVQEPRPLRHGAVGVCLLSRGDVRLPGRDRHPHPRHLARLVRSVKWVENFAACMRPARRHCSSSCVDVRAGEPALPVDSGPCRGEAGPGSREVARQGREDELDILLEEVAVVNTGSRKDGRVRHVYHEEAPRDSWLVLDVSQVQGMASSDDVSLSVVLQQAEVDHGLHDDHVPLATRALGCATDWGVAVGLCAASLTTGTCSSTLSP
eukprot:766480-Hanusia_phi.AAC.16